MTSHHGLLERAAADRARGSRSTLCGVAHFIARALTHARTKMSTVAVRAAALTANPLRARARTVRLPRHPGLGARTNERVVGVRHPRVSARLTLPSHRRFPTPQTRSSRASRISTAPRAFLKGIFGGGGSDADVADADATPKIATGEKQIVTVTLRRPMGMVLEPADGEKRGAIVAEVVEGGNAEATGMIEVGDVLLSCAFDADECALGDRWYESVMDELAGSPSARRSP